MSGLLNLGEEGEVSENAEPGGGCARGTARVDNYKYPLAPTSSNSISLFDVGNIATSAIVFCEDFVAFFAKFARTIAKFARIDSECLG